MFLKSQHEFILVFLLSVICLSPVHAQVGPPDPQPPAPQGNTSLDSIRNSFLKFFSKDKDSQKSENGESKENSSPLQQNYGPENDAMHGPPHTSKESSGNEQKHHNDNKNDKKTVERTSPQPPEREPLLAKPALNNPKVEEPSISEDNPPPKMPTLDNPNNPLGLADAHNRLNNTAALIDKKQYTSAKVTLEPIRQWLIESTEAHLGLYKTLNSLPSARAQAELEKQLALQFAILRDKSFYQMGRIYAAQADYRKAIKELVEVVKSQPKSDLGIKSYQLLQEIGFTQKLQIVD